MLFTTRVQRPALLIATLLAASALALAAGVTTEVLASAPADAQVTVGPNAKIITWYVPVGDGADIFINGKKESHSDMMAHESSDDEGEINFAFSEDGAHYAYVIAHGDKSAVCIDGKSAWEGELSLDSRVSFSPTGKHFWMSNENTLILDGIEWPKWSPGRDEQNLAFSPVDETAVLVVNKGNQRILRDGKEVAAADAIRLLGFLPDGRLAWVAGTNPPGERWTHALYIDGVLVETLAWDEDIAPQYFDLASPGGRHTVFVIVKNEMDGGPTFLLLDGKRSGPYQGRFVNLSLAPDGTLLAVLKHDEGNEPEEQIIHNHDVGPIFAEIECAAFSPSGKHYAYVGHRADGTRVLNVDGAPVTPELPSIPNSVLHFSTFAWDANEQVSLITRSFQKDTTTFLQCGTHKYGPYIGTMYETLGPDGVLRYMATTDPKAQQWTLYTNGGPVDGTQCSSPDQLLQTPNGYMLIAERSGDKGTDIVRITIPLTPGP